MIPNFKPTFPVGQNILEDYYILTLTRARHEHKNTMLKMDILSNNQHDVRKISSNCRSFAQLPGQNSYCSKTIMVQKELDERLLCLNFFGELVFGQTAG